MQHFESDYVEGCHPAILERLSKINSNKYQGYGADEITRDASQKILNECCLPGGRVFFLAGGTQANLVTLDGLLRSQQGVLCAKTAHIAIHEAGAVERTGHKVLTLHSHDGKVDPLEARNWLETFYADANCSHMVAPGALYLSHPTEYGTLYTKSELEEFDRLCEEFGMLLYLDGARLGYGIVAEGTDVTLPIIAKHCDAFTIGGTKLGCLFGEAVVLSRNSISPYFFALQKQHGALLAKTWVAAAQFDTLFTDDLYKKIARRGNDMAKIFEVSFREKNLQFFVDSPTNQKFIVMDNDAIEKLEENVTVSKFEPYDKTHSVLRIATSWATKQEDVIEACKYF